MIAPMNNPLMMLVQTMRGGGDPKLAASQASQNSYLTATLDAQTSELIRRINPMPVPAYQVPAPYPFCGTGNGCGCGC